MANIVSYDIDIDDTAPQITYSPLIQSNETYSPNPLDGWILNFINGSGFNTSPGQIAVGQSAHITAKDGATMSIAFTGACLLSSITIYYSLSMRPYVNHCIRDETFRTIRRCPIRSASWSPNSAQLALVTA